MYWENIFKELHEGLNHEQEYDKLWKLVFHTEGDEFGKIYKSNSGTLLVHKNMHQAMELPESL